MAQKIFTFGSAVAAAAILYAMGPDLLRYLRIKTM
jgi:hypothetical protein